MREGIKAAASFRDIVTDLSLMLLFLLFAIAPALIMKVPASSAPQPSNGTSNLPVVFLTEKPIKHNFHPEEANDSIYAWIQLKNPFFGLLPECKYGFWQFLDSTKNRDFAKSNDGSSIVPPQATVGKLQPMQGIHVDKEEGSVLLEPLMGINVYMPPRPQTEEETGAFWLDDKGRLMLNPPEIDLVNARRAVAAGPGDMIIRNTVLHVLPSAMPETPLRIVVRQSSGNSELDRQAVSALRKHIVKASLEAGAIPVPTEGLLLEILWKLF